MRNVAWKTSSACWRSRNTPRPVASTIPPCRRTSASNAASAASSGPFRNRPSSSRSDRPAADPTRNSTSRSRKALPPSHVHRRDPPLTRASTRCEARPSGSSDFFSRVAKMIRGGGVHPPRTAATSVFVIGCHDRAFRHLSGTLFACCFASPFPRRLSSSRFIAIHLLDQEVEIHAKLGKQMVRVAERIMEERVAERPRLILNETGEIDCRRIQNVFHDSRIKRNSSFLII